MRARHLLLPLVALPLLAGACGKKTDASGLTPRESRQLDEAAASQDANSVDTNVQLVINNQDQDQ